MGNTPANGQRLKHKEPCRKCGAQMLFIPGASHAVWHHPAAHPQDVKRVQIGVRLLPPLEHKGDVYQFECESCGHPLQVVEAERAVATMHGGTDV